jgi:hypothetical protein
LVVDRPVDNETTPLWAVLMPEDAEVESEPTLLFVVDRPVDNEPTPLWAVLMPEDAEAESEPTLLLVVDRPDEADVDREPM